MKSDWLSSKITARLASGRNCVPARDERGSVQFETTVVRGMPDAKRNDPGPITI
jgi:hypothetical protein